MSYRDRLRAASFRGVPFHVQSDDVSGGRAVVSHAYPGRGSYPEDLGTQPRVMEFAAYVIGADYDIDRDRLIAALEMPGPGELVHPRHGSMMAQADGFTVSEAAGRQRLASFRLRFERADLAPSPVSIVDTQAQVNRAADFADLETLAGYEAAFDIAGLPDWAVALSGAPLSSAADLLMAGAVDLTASMGGFVDPDTAARAAGIGTAFADAVATVRAVLDLTAFADFAEGLTAFAPAAAGLATPTRLRAAGNATLAAGLVRRLALTGWARTAAAAEFGNADAALGMRARLGEALRVEALTAADGSEDRAATALFDLRGRVVADLTDRAAKLERLVPFELPSGPVLEIAQRLYGDGARAEELILAAPAPHPLFHAGTGLAIGR
jgi:prophage DNA circulation protein